MASANEMRAAARALASLLVDPVREADVELDDLGRQAKRVLQAGESGPRVVDGDPPAPAPQAVQGRDEGVVVLHLLVLGDLHDERVPRRGVDGVDQFGRHRGPMRHVQREVGIVGDAHEVGEGQADRHELEVQLQRDLPGLGEPVIRRAVRGQGEPSQGLVADHGAPA